MQLHNSKFKYDKPYRSGWQMKYMASQEIYGVKWILRNCKLVNVCKYDLLIDIVSGNQSDN